MLTFSAFDRSTLKLFVAAFFVLGGASVATARAQDGRGAIACIPETCPDAYAYIAIGTGIQTEIAPLPLSISEWNSAFAVPDVHGNDIGIAANSLDAPTGVFGDPIGSPIAYGSNETTEWNNAIVGSPNAGDGPMSAESLAARPTCVVYDGGNRALIQGAALHDDAAPVAVMVNDRIGGSSLHATTAGDGGFFSLDLAAPYGAIAVHVVVAGQPDVLAACTNPDNAAVLGMGLSGVAISNSMPAAETTEHVDAAVNAYNLF